MCCAESLVLIISFEIPIIILITNEVSLLEFCNLFNGNSNGKNNGNSKGKERRL